MEIAPQVFIGVQMITDGLTTQELVTLVNAITFKGFNLKGLALYDKIEALLESDGSMHRDVRESIIILAGRRLKG